MTDLEIQQLTQALPDGALARGLGMSLRVAAVDGAIAIDVDATILITKGSAIAATVAAPGASGIGRRLRILSGTDFAHVVTFTGGTLWDGTAGANTTATFAAVQGSAIEVVGVTAAKWNVVSLNAVTPAP